MGVWLAACTAAKPAAGDPDVEPPALAQALSSTPTVPTPTPEPTAEPVDECVACHTDKERLIDTADPVVETEGESSGVG